MDIKTRRKSMHASPISVDKARSSGVLPPALTAGDPLADAGMVAEPDAAALLGVKVQTLRKWAVQRKGPARVKCGKRVLYRRASLHAWLAGQEYDPAAARRA
jgi:hypothetical protein